MKHYEVLCCIYGKKLAFSHILSLANLLVSSITKSLHSFESRSTVVSTSKSTEYKS